MNGPKKNPATNQPAPKQPLIRGRTLVIWILLVGACVGLWTLFSDNDEEPPTETAAPAPPPKPHVSTRLLEPEPSLPPVESLAPRSPPPPTQPEPPTIAVATRVSEPAAHVRSPAVPAILIQQAAMRSRLSKVMAAWAVKKQSVHDSPVYDVVLQTAEAKIASGDLAGAKQILDGFVKKTLGGVEP